MYFQNKFAILKKEKKNGNQRDIREGDRRLKEKFEGLLRGESIVSPMDEQIVYNQLNGNERAIWSLLLTSGYLKVLSFEDYRDIPEGV